MLSKNHQSGEELRGKLEGDTALLSESGSNNHAGEPSDSSSDSFTLISEEESTELGSNDESEPVESSSDSSTGCTELSEEEESAELGSNDDSEPAESSSDSSAGCTELSEETFKPTNALTMDTKLLEEEESGCSSSTCPCTPTRGTISEEALQWAVVSLVITLASLVTTLVVKGLPRNCSRQFFVEHIRPADGSVDFLDVPWNKNQRRPCQYCFVNFVSPPRARAFWARWNGRFLDRAKKPLDIQPALVQGLKALVEQHLLCQRGDNKPKCPPAVFRGEQQIDFAELLQRLGMHPEQ